MGSAVAHTYHFTTFLRCRWCALDLPAVPTPTPLPTSVPSYLWLYYPFSLRGTARWNVLHYHPICMPALVLLYHLCHSSIPFFYVLPFARVLYPATLRFQRQVLRLPGRAHHTLARAWRLPHLRVHLMTHAGGLFFHPILYFWARSTTFARSRTLPFLISSFTTADVGRAHCYAAFFFAAAHADFVQLPSCHACCLMPCL